MPNSTSLKKATLVELDPQLQNQSGGKTVTVQFNPESLKVSFSNQIVQPTNTDTGSGKTKSQSATQFVGAGTTKLSLQLWFDVNAPLPEGAAQVDDVRNLTKDVSYFITPKPVGDQFVPPLVRFLWGSFQFDGIVDSIEESLEFFSGEGVPLRASMTLSMSQQKIVAVTPQGSSGQGAPGVKTPGTTPLTQATGGMTLQDLAANLGKGASWQAIAQANGIENPRLLQPGQLLNLNVGTSGSLGASFGGSASVSVGGSLGASTGGSSDAISGSLSANIGG